MKIELEHISKHFKIQGVTGRREVLKDISLTIHSGDSIAIVGPSGSGKSTLLNMIGTLDMPSLGMIRFDGEDVRNMDEKHLAVLRNNHIGFVFQLHHLLPQLTLLENVLLPLIPQKDKKKREQRNSNAIELLDAVGLADKIRQRPGQMSVGECQRAAVVRALVNEPGFILADEPTGSLDQNLAEQMGELLSKINKEHGVAMVVVTHSEKLAKKMDTIYNLVNGRLVIED